MEQLYLATDITVEIEVSFLFRLREFVKNYLQSWLNRMFLRKKVTIAIKNVEVGQKKFMLKYLLY